jgi:ABC-type uncharacterized transport system involved in gliding motility auxiliary subunit
MTLKNIKTLTKSEIAGYFVSPAAYVFVIIFLVLTGFFTFMIGDFFKAGDASLNAFFYWHPWLYLILVPAVGMHMWSDEKKSGTNELLFTLPVTVFECIISKFIAAWMVIGVALLMTFPMVITVCYLGNPDEWAIACGYLGSFLLAGAYLAIASFTSSFTKSQVVSFIVSLIICFFLILAGWPQVIDMLVEWAPRELIDIVASFSVWPYFHSMQRGVIDSRDILYFFSIIGFGLFLTDVSLKKHKGTILSSIFGSIVVGLIVILLNALLGTVNYRMDFTENKIYTLSDASRKIIRKIDKPVTVKFYCSRSNNRMPVNLKNFADRIEDLLGEYKEAGNGNIIIEKFDPKQFSDAEDSAIMDGIAGQLLTTGEKIYLGIAVSCGKQISTIPFVSPLKENLLEYTVTSAITEVFKTKKATIGIMSALPVTGGTPTPAMMQKGIFKMIQPWLFVKQLKKDFNVKKVNLTAKKIDDDIDLLMLFHPAGISPETQFAVDQFIMKGGKVIALVDPFSFVTKNMSKTDSSLKNKFSSNLPELFKAWGVKFNTDRVVADAIFGRRMRVKGREANFLAVMDIGKKGLNNSDVITSELDNVTMLFSGSLSVKNQPGLNSEVLMHTTKDSGTIMASIADDPQLSFRKFAADDKVYNLAVRLTGKFKTAFPEGRPADKGKKKKGEFLAESQKQPAVIILADSDFLYDEFCVQVDQRSGRALIRLVNDNLNLSQNMADALGGDSDMIGIRCRPAMVRPFARVKKIEADAEKVFKAKILKLESDLKATQNRLNLLQKLKSSKSQQMVLSPAQQKELKKFREQQITVRKELKQVQKEFRREVDHLEVVLKWLNILAVPALIALFGIVFGVIRKIRGGAH